MNDAKPLKVLAVEDSTSDARALKALLRDADASCELTHVRTLEAAELALINGKYDGVLLDLGLPDGDGIENVERMRAAAPDAAIVVLTGRDDDGSALQALRSGAQEYLIKGGYDSEALLRSIQHAIERHRLMAQLSDEREREYFRASHDLLTGLPNRQLFMDRARVALNKAARSSERFALCFVDLDGFKPVNDRHGHGTGDALLREVARALREGLRDSDTVARVGGDEFMVLLSPMTLASGDQEAEVIMQRMIRRVAAIARIGDREVSIGASVGIALFPAHGNSLDMLIAHADEAMYRAKRSGKGQVCLWMPLAPVEDSRTSAGSFQLHYLPWLDGNSVVVGCEALPPSDQAATLPFLRVLARALADWPQRGATATPPLRLAVSVIASELQRADSAAVLLAELQSRHFAPQDLRVCVAAADMAAASERCLQTLHSLRAAGVQVALSHCAPEDLDLARLADWPLDALILDPSWPARLHSGENRLVALLTGLQAFQAVLGRESLLSGVDYATVSQLRAQFGAVSMQGTALMPAVTAAQLAELARNPASMARRK